MPDNTLHILQALQVIWLIGLTVATWLRKPGIDAGKAVEQIKTELTAALHEQRRELEAEMREAQEKLVELATNLAHMPDSEELAKLEGTVKQIDARTLGMVESMQSVRQAIARVEDFLLKSR